MSVIGRLWVTRGGVTVEQRGAAWFWGGFHRICAYKATGGRHGALKTKLLREATMAEAKAFADARKRVRR